MGGFEEDVEDDVGEAPPLPSLNLLCFLDGCEGHDGVADASGQAASSPSFPVFPAPLLLLLPGNEAHWASLSGAVVPPPDLVHAWQVSLF